MQKYLKKLFVAIIVISIFLGNSETIAQSFSCGPISIESAEEFYIIGKFESCIKLLNSCLQTDSLNFSEKIQAYRYLSMSYLAIDSIDQADKSIGHLLILQDSFEPFSNDPYRFRIEILYQRQLLRANLISSVSKKAENIKLAPATIQIITEKDIKLRGYQDIESVLYDLPGFDISRDFGITFSTLYQRGYRSATMTERTLFLIDGVDGNELWTNSVFITKQFPITKVKRVEVIYGPASTIYGANAFVGVVNVVTKGEDDYFPADRQEIEGKRKSLSIETLAGYGALNTKYLDLTIANRGKKNTYFSLTSRIYKSNGFDLSSDSNWDGKLNYSRQVYQDNFTLNKPSFLTINNFTQLDPNNIYHQLSKDSSRIIPTQLAINLASELDESGYKQIYKGLDPSKFSNPINDYYISGKARVSDFNIGFEFWNKNEGAVGTYIDRYASVNSALTNWQVRQYYFNVKYQKNLSDKISFDNFTYFRGSDFGNNSRVTGYRSYGNKSLQLYDLILSNGTKMGSFATTYYGQTATQFKTELKLAYRITEHIDLNSGFELKTNSLQGDYVKGSKYPAIQFGLVTNGSNLPGGNNFTGYTTSAFSQFNTSNSEKHYNISLAYRVDYNIIPKEAAGYGLVFNPRFAVIYYPNKMIFKAFYSEAFMDASAFNKFAISASRLVNNPHLSPEKVKNFELSAQYTFNITRPNNHLEFTYYNARYSSTLALINYKIPGTTIITNRFEALGKANISGLQISGNYQVTEHIHFFVNFTLTDPYITLQKVNTRSDSLTKRTGDIAKYSSNFGFNLNLLRNKRLNLNLRINATGDKPTGISTSISDNPLSKINGYSLLNINIGYQVNEQLRLQFACTNLLDKSYRSPGIRLADDVQHPSSIPQYGRMLQFQLMYYVKK